MLRSLAIAVAAAAFGTLLSLPAPAQTADSIPPAKEGICDTLKGGTPGLYGLCVAYCEAQDLNEVFQQIKAGGHPGEKILANYNKKKQPGDPDMPCIVSSPQACPCFNINLCNAGGSNFKCEVNILNVSELFTGQSCTLLQTCQNSATPNRTALDACNTLSGTTFEARTVQVAVSEGGEPGACLARSQTTPGSGTTQNSDTGMILDYDTSLKCLEEINAYDGNGPLDGNLNGNPPDYQMCTLAN